MRNSLKYRACLIILMFLTGLVTFFAISKPVRSRDQSDPHSIVVHFREPSSPVVVFDLGLALANTLFILFPVALVFLLIDLYGLRKAPVEQIGCFAYCLVAILLNVIVSMGLWFMFGGWGPPVFAPAIIAILVVMVIPATISEWRIFRAPPESEETDG